jgi:hypothetical protein
VHRAPNGTYEGALAVLFPDLVLFLERDTPSIELCRVTSARPRDSHGASFDDDDNDDALPSLRVMRTLALPAFHPDYRVHTAYTQTDRHIEHHQHQRDVPEAHPQEEKEEHEQEERHRAPPARRAPAPLPFHSAPEDMVVGITFLLRLRGAHAIWKKVVTTISHRALFALAASERCPTDDDDDGDDDDYCEVEEGEADDGACGGEEGQRGEDGANEDEDEDEVRVGQAVVPWEEWGPRAARVISPSSFQWITAHAGQRLLSLESDTLVVRYFNAVRVRRARARCPYFRQHTSR